MVHSLYDLLQRLDEANIHYTLSRHRGEAVLVTVSFVSERVDVDVFEDGHMEVSRFLGTEDVLGGQELIYDLIERAIFEDKAYEEKYSKKRES
jgi:hypothetical protein